MAPWKNDSSLVHLGVAASYREADGDNEVRFRERPESHVTSTRLVNTGTLEDYDNQTLLGAEAAAVFGPFSMQGEYIQTSVDLDGSGSDPDSMAGMFMEVIFSLGSADRIKLVVVPLVA
jgi:phosphate-selective porin OprO/OprP